MPAPADPARPATAAGSAKPGAGERWPRHGVGMTPQVLPLDPADEPTVATVQQLREAAEAVDTPDLPPPCPYPFRAQLSHPVSSWRAERFVARVAGDEVAGYLMLDLPLRANLTNAELTLVVHPVHRRRGIGRALFAHALARLRELGRVRYNASTVEALPQGPARDHAGRAFATAVGAKPALSETRHRLELAGLDRPALAELRVRAEDRATGYQMVTWQDAAPERYAADVVYLDGRLTSDAPMGDLIWETPTPDTSRLREREAQLAAGRWHLYQAGAVHQASGRLVAFTRLSRQESSPWHAFQWITLVDPEHRGHRLGALLKLANLNLVRQHEPALRVIDTWNATTNRHMIAVNEALGFRPVDARVNWQQEV